MNSTKLCKDCKHFVRDQDPVARIFKSLFLKYAKCGLTEDLVTGAPETFCSIERKDYNECGVDGRNWEAKDE